MKPHDSICETGKCCHREDCPSPCPPVLWINGKSKRKEPLVKAAMWRETSGENYNGVVADMIRNHDESESRRLEAIRSVANLRRRFVLAAMMVGIPQDDIGKQMKISQRTVSRISIGK